MAKTPRYELAVRTVLVTWRQSMTQIRDGSIPNSHETTAAVTGRALAALQAVAEHVVVDNERDRQRFVQLLMAARAEIHGAVRHDFATGDEAC